MATRTLTPERMDAFVEELQKLGGVGNFLRGHVAGLGEGVARMGQMLMPGRAGRLMAEGWDDFAPVHMEMNRLLRNARNEGKTYAEYAVENRLHRDPLTQAKLQFQRAANAADAELPAARAADATQTGWEGRPTWLGGSGSRGRAKKLEKDEARRYLGDEATPLAEVYRDPHRLAEELSRRGWTGTGETTRYLPVGQKSLMAGFGLGFLPGAVSSEDPMGLDRGRGERFGEHLGQNVGFIAGAPAGLVGGIAAGSLAGEAMGTMGKGVDFVLPKRMTEEERQRQQLLQQRQLALQQQRGEG